MSPRFGSLGFRCRCRTACRRLFILSWLAFFLLGKKLVVFFSYRYRLPFFSRATGEDPCCTGGKFARVSAQKKTKHCSMLRDSVMPQHLSVQVPVVLRSPCALADVPVTNANHRCPHDISTYSTGTVCDTYACVLVRASMGT